MSEQFYAQVAESIKLVFDLSSRIDERVKMLVERQNEVDERVEKMLETLNTLIARITILESKDITGVKTDLADMGHRLTIIESAGTPFIRNEMESMKNKIQMLELRNESLIQRSQNQENKWNRISDFIIKMGFLLLSSYLIYKFGWAVSPQ